MINWKVLVRIIIIIIIPPWLLRGTCHSERSWTSLAILCQSDLDLRNSRPTDRFQVSLGPVSSCPVGSIAVTQSWGFLIVFPLHLHFLLCMWLAIFSWVISRSIHCRLLKAIWFLRWSGSICWQISGSCPLFAWSSSRNSKWKFLALWLVASSASDSDYLFFTGS